MGLKDFGKRLETAARIITRRPAFGQFASSATAYGRSPYAFGYWDDAFPNPDDTPIRAGQAGQYDFYENIIKRDPVIGHAIRERVSAITGLDSTIEPYDETPDAARIQEFSVEAIRRTWRFKNSLRGLIKGGYQSGFAVGEVIYDRMEWPGGGLSPFGGDWMFPSEVMNLNPKYFSFRRGDAALMYSPYGFTGGGMIECPERKFIVFTYDGDYENPYGYSMLAPLYLLHRFMKHDLKYWGIYNEKFSVPTLLAIAFKELGLDVATMKKVLEGFQVDSQVVIELATRNEGGRLIGDNGPIVKIDDMIKIAEVASGGRVNNFSDFFGVCKKIVLENIQGTALLTEEGQGGTGSYALGRAQIDAKWLPVIADDVDSIEELLSDTIFKWIAEINFGVGAPAARYKIVTDKPQDKKATADFYKTMGDVLKSAKDQDGEKIKISLKQFREETGLREPEAEEDELVFGGDPMGALGGQFPPGVGPDPAMLPPGNKGGKDPAIDKLDEMDDAKSKDDKKKDDKKGPKVVTSHKAAAERDERAALRQVIEMERLREENRRPFDRGIEGFYRSFAAYARKKYPAGEGAIAADWDPDNEMAKPKIARVANALIPAFQFFWLVGATQSAAMINGAAIAAARPKAYNIDQIIDELDSKVGYPKSDWEAAEEAIRRQAWTVARTESAWAVEQARSITAFTIANGGTKGDFAAALDNKFAGTQKYTPWHAEVIYRTNSATVYNAARQSMFSTPLAKAMFPMWAYVAILDDRTSEICWELKDVVLDADDFRWNFIYPPNHHACRSAVMPIPFPRIEREGIHVVEFEFPEGIDADFAISPMAYLGLK